MTRELEEFEIRGIEMEWTTFRRRTGLLTNG